MKTNDKILTELNEVIQYFINHPDNQPNTDHCRNVDRLINLKADLANGDNTENEPSINYDGVLAAGDSLKSDEFRIHLIEPDELKIVATGVGFDNIRIEPVSANCIIVHACS